MSKSESRLEKLAREGAAAMARHVSDGQAVRDRTARLKSQRLAKEAADLAAGVQKKPDGTKSRKLAKAIPVRKLNASNDV
jgi:hypothetical protein